MFTGAGAVVLCLVRDKVHVYWGWCCGVVSSQR